MLTYSFQSYDTNNNCSIILYVKYSDGVNKIQKFLLVCIAIRGLKWWSNWLNINVWHLLWWHANVKPNPNPNPNPYTTLTQKPNDNSRSYSLLLEISSQEHLSLEQMLDHLIFRKKHLCRWSLLFSLKKFNKFPFQNHWKIIHSYQAFFYMQK